MVRFHQPPPYLKVRNMKPPRDTEEADNAIAFRLAMAELDMRDKKIARLYMTEMRVRDIAIRVSMSRSGVYSRLKKMQTAFRDFQR